MTLESTTVKVSYAGDDATVSFPVTFIYWDDTDIEVILRTDATGAETTWVDGTQYTLSGGDGATGTLAVDTSPTDYTPATGETLVIRSNREDKQSTVFPLGGSFPSTSAEDANDKQVRLIQQRTEELSRTIKVSKSSPLSDLEFPEPVAGNVLVWNPGEDGFDNAEPLAGSILLNENNMASNSSSQGVVQSSLVAFTEGLTGISVSRFGGDIHAAILAIGSIKGTLVIDTDVVMTKDDTVPSTTTLVFIRGNTINGAWTLTVNAGIEAGLYQVFGTSVTVSGLTEVHPEWWGYSSSATSLNNRTYFNSALQSLVNKGALYVSPGVVESDLSVGGFLLPSGEIKIYGAGESSKMNIVNPGTNDVFDTQDFDGNRFKDFKLNGDGNGTSSAIRTGPNAWRNKVSGMFISGHSEHGIIIDGWKTSVKETYIALNGVDGINSDKDRLGAGTGFNVELSLIDNYIVNNVRNGIYLNKVATARCERNEIGANGNNGISCVGNNKGFVALSNHLENNGNDGLFVQASIAPTIIGNRAFGPSSGATQKYGIHVNFCTGGTVLSNKTLNNVTSGIMVTTPQGGKQVLLGGNSETPLLDASVTPDLVVDLDSISIKDGIVYGTHLGPVQVSNNRTSLFAVNKTVADNTTVDFMSFTSTVGGFAGIITIVARAPTEDSSHIYHITSDATGYTLTELGVGRDRNGTIACTATITGAEGEILTLTADTTANDWAASPVVTIKADITASGTITTLEL